MGFTDFLKKIFPCCFKAEGEAEMKSKKTDSGAAKQAKADKPAKQKPAKAASTTTTTTTTQQQPPKQEPQKQQKPAKSKNGEPEHFHDNDELAAKANVYRDKARKLRDEAHKPENKSNKGQLLDQANAEDAKASKMIFETLQKKQPEGTIDLHLQFVAEAVRICDEQLALGRKKGWKKMVIITGKGNHSEGGKCKIAPAVEEWAAKNKLPLEQGEGKVTVKL